MNNVMLAKCDYTTERYVVLMQLGTLVGIIWMAARWASIPEEKHEPRDWDFYVDQLRKVVGWNAEALEGHAHEWVGMPVRVYYSGDVRPVTETPCTPLSTASVCHEPQGLRGAP